MSKGEASSFDFISAIFIITYSVVSRNHSLMFWRMMTEEYPIGSDPTMQKYFHCTRFNLVRTCSIVA